LVSPSLQCSSSPIGFGQGFLSKEECDDIGAFHTHTLLTLFQLIFTCSLDRNQRFCDANSIIKNATEELKRFSQDGFQKCFKHIYS
jgi:hypothetical protein